MSTASELIVVPPVDPVAAVACADPVNLRPTHEPPRRSFFGWRPTDRDQLARVEACMLQHLTRPAHQRFVVGLNTVSSALPRDAAASTVRRHIVLLHGFGGGLATWLPNFNFLVAAAAREKRLTQIHMLDLPGFARSERHPEVRFKSDKDAMDYMCGHLHEWFAAMGLDPNRHGGAPPPDAATASRSPPQVELVGHSFGAYISATFAHRYPSLVKRVVLCDPWGVPPKPEDMEKMMSFKYRTLLKIFYAGNPFSILRIVGPWGPRLLPKVRADFADRWEPIIGNPTVFFDYIYHANAHHVPTGEQAFQACCTGPAYAKTPLLSFFPSLPSSVDLGVIYGSHTWMDKAAGIELVRLAQEKRPTSRNDHRFVQNAGHQVNTDNIDGFNSVLAELLGLAVSRRA